MKCKSFFIFLALLLLFAAPGWAGETVTVSTLEDLQAVCTSDDNNYYILSTNVDTLNFSGNITLGRDDERFSNNAESLLITHSVTLHGGGHTLSGIHGDTVIKVPYNLGETVFDGIKLTIDNLTITGADSAENGGGIYFACDDGELSLDHCAFVNNKAGGGGGGIYFKSKNGKLTVAHCTFKGNGAYNNEDNTNSRGGGICASGPNVTAFVAHCTFTGNKTSGDGGGGIYFSSVDDDNPSAPVGKLTLAHCTFVNNEAENVTEVRCDGGAFNAVNTVFWNSDKKYGVSGIVSLDHCAYGPDTINFEKSPNLVSEDCVADLDWSSHTSRDVTVDGVTHTVFPLTAADTKLIGQGLTADGVVSALKLTDATTPTAPLMRNMLSTDQLGHTRNSTPDIGAWEYVNVEGATLKTLKGNPGALTIGGTAELSVDITPKDAMDKTVTWTTSSADIAAVTATGVITGKAAGTATITATSVENTDIQATCDVTVQAQTVPVTGVTLSSTDVTLNKGDKVTLSVDVAPADASNRDVTWSVTKGEDNGEVALYSDADCTKPVNSNTALPAGTVYVKGLSAGTATITATAGEVSRTCKVMVTDKSETDKDKDETDKGKDETDKGNGEKPGDGGNGTDNNGSRNNGNGTEEDPTSKKGKSYAPAFDLKAVASLIRAFFSGWTGDIFLFPFAPDKEAAVSGDRTVADLSPDQLREVSNDHSVILAILPEITPKVTAVFVLGVSFDITPEGTLKWHGFPKTAESKVALAADEEECLFLNDKGEEITTAPSNGHLNVAVKLTKDVTYAPVITAETATSTGPTSDKDGGGCSAGFAGVAGLMAVIPSLSRKRK